MLKVIDINIPFDGQLITPYSFPLDNFQKYALDAINKNENVLVTAKTGSGKTLVGEYQIYKCLLENRKVIFTTPIKSLSNQKFYDFKKIYGSENVGIITGDIKFQPQAPILIMTTEILRNLLYKENTITANTGICSGVSLDGLGAVVFDEVHYINDKDRGKVWEETLILLDSTINLVLLSATIDSPELFGEWLAKIKNKNINLISTTYRVVPLTHYIYTLKAESEFDIITTLTNDNKYYENDYALHLNNLRKRVKDMDDHKIAVKMRESNQEVVKKAIRKYSPIHTINKCIQHLETNNQLPALFFVFSRDDCEKYARSVEQSLLEGPDIANCKNMTEFYLHSYRDKIEHLSQYHLLLSLLKKGVAFHHSGMLPILKEIVEILFNKGYIKVLFATETFSVGINMPTKTVVFLDFQKYDDSIQDFRILNTAEYTQMAGRAGRRGIDTQGIVIYLPIKNVLNSREIKTMMVGNLPTFESRIDYDYNFILKMLHKGLKYKTVFDNSFDFYRRTEAKKELELDIEKNIVKQNELELEVYLPDLLQKANLMSVEKTKDIQRQINAWDNKHMGPKWLQAGKKFVDWKQYQFYIDKNKKELETLFETDIDEKINFLIENGFVNDDLTLTQKGLIATEINQGDCMIVSEDYIKGKFNKLTPEEIIGLATTYIEDKDKWLEPVIEWVNGSILEEVCVKYGVFPGNFYRAITTIGILLDEFESVATLMNDVELLDKLIKCKELITKDVAISASLYVKN